MREAARGCRTWTLILLPECVDFLARSPEEALAQAQPIPGPYTMRDVPPGPGAPRQPGARKHHGADGVGQGAQYHGLDRPGGEILGRYSKMHLFDALNYRESDHVQAGDEICLLDTDIGRVGIQICYDCRFPELARTQVLKGRICCASWPASPGARPARPDGALGPADRFHGPAEPDLGMRGQPVWNRSRPASLWPQPDHRSPGAPRWRWPAGGPALSTECWIWSISGSAGEQVGGLHNRRPELYFR